MNVPHSHWEQYHMRIVPKELNLNNLNIKDVDKEILQLICIQDGEIFHEVELKKSK